MEIKEGMYVRTNTGIHKIFKIDNNKTVWKYYCDKKETGEWDGSYEYTPIKEEQFIGEPSFDIIDLIQVGDIVKWEIYKPYKDGGVNEVIQRFNKGLGIYQIESDCVLRLGDMVIKSIVTKEQFEQMEYKL